MRVCIIGAGAIGSLLAVHLATAGVAVTVVDQGAQLEGIRRNGLRLVHSDGRILEAAGICAVEDTASLDVQDYVVLAVKAHQLRHVAPSLTPIFHADTAVVTVQNGLPWWYFLGQSGPFSNLSLRSLDADGTLEQHIPVSKVIGCVAYPAATVIEPGLTRIVEGNRLTFGEPDNSSSDRSTRIADACTSGGLKGFVTQDIRAELWLKAWGALAFNTVSALTGSTMREIAQDPGTRALVTRVMTEAQTIASKLGVQIRHTIEKRIEGATQVGAHKTSMLQDVEAGRTLEINAVIGVFVELAALTSTPAPSIEAIHACCNLLNARLARTGADGLPGSGMARPSPLAQLDGGMS